MNSQSQSQDSSNSPHSPPWKHVWITGASSGLGEYTARLLADQGCIVSISARRIEQLETIAKDSPNIFAYPVDVTDAEAVKTVAAQAETDHGPIDLAMFSAGAWFPGSIQDMRVENFAKTLNVNVLGVAHGMDAVLPQMLERSSGHISWISSVAGYVGLPNSAAYSASKSALISLAESVHGELQQKGIAVSVINPGFVRTQLTDKNKFPMPFLMEPEPAAEKIVAGLKRKKFEIAFPWQMVLILKTLRILPYWLSLALMKRMV
ncbi:MAG: SDR family NAD(P)-dependent oxidoreductase [Rhizobiaceae bacterium]